MTDTYTKFRNEVMAGGADSPELEPTAGGRRAILGMGIIGGLLIALYMWSPWAFLFVIGLLISIFLHELGHFSTARWTGMKATQFFLFMGPKLWSFRRGETEYGVRAYPVGAFVRIIGMNNLDEVDPADEPRAYRNKSYPRRMLVITAGSIMHILIAIVLIFAVYAVNGKRVETGRVGIGSVVVGYPAQQAGVEAGDIILSIDGVEPTTPDAFVDQIRASEPGDSVVLVLERDGVTVLKEVELGANPNPGEGFGKAFSAFLPEPRSSGTTSRSPQPPGTASSISDRRCGRASAASSRSSTRSTSSGTCPVRTRISTHDRRRSSASAR